MKFSTFSTLAAGLCIFSVAEGQALAKWSWVATDSTQPVPAYTVVAGNEPATGGGTRTLYVCRAPYAGGLHPGKILNGVCHIGYGGTEYSLNTYEALVDPDGTFFWTNTRYPNPWCQPGGWNGPNHSLSNALGVCRASYNGGTHSGKQMGNECLIGWGGREVHLSKWELLYSLCSIFEAPESVPAPANFGGPAEFPAVPDQPLGPAASPAPFGQ